ncbi:hypothetical protein X975_12551, partial [Stegodyphus mimosarum]
MALFRWSENQIFQVIDFYREHVVLWDTNNTNFKNKKLKDSLILDLSTQIGVPENEIKKKWSNLRTQFTKEKHKEKKNYTSGASTAKQYKSTWHFYTPLQFLRDAVSTRNTVTSLDFNDTTTQERSVEVARHSDEVFDINDFEEQDTEETQRKLCHTQTLPQLKRHTSNTTTSNKKQKHDHIYTATLEEISTILKSKNTTPNTFTQFGSFVGSELSLIHDPQLLTDTKYKIYQILTDAQT